MKNLIRLKQIFAVILLCLPGTVAAEEILPVAQGRFSVTLVLDKNTPQPPAGAWVKFLGTTHKNISHFLRIGEGFVLGTRGNVVFIELSKEDAELLAHQLVSERIRIRKSRDPDPKMVAARRQAADEGRLIQLAPRLRTVSVSVKITAERVAAWEPGIGLTFPDAREQKRFSYRDDSVRSIFHDIRAQFVSAVSTGDGKFDVTVIAQPSDAAELRKAEVNGRLSAIVAEGEPKLTPAEEQRCYITHRRGTERVRIDIPCT